MKDTTEQRKLSIWPQHTRHRVLKCRLAGSLFILQRMKPLLSVIWASSHTRRGRGFFLVIYYIYTIEFQSDDITKMFFLKLWVLFDCFFLVIYHIYTIEVIRPSTKSKKSDNTILVVAPYKPCFTQQ